MAPAQESFDVTVIGSGPGGYVAAIRAAQLGKKVALVEKSPPLGGTCLHWGCIPTKALLEAAHVLELASNAGEFGIYTEKVGFDWSAVQKRKQAVVNGQAKGLDYLMKKNKIQVFAGTGKLDGQGKLSVTEKSGKQVSIASPNIIIATGSKPRALRHLPVDGNTVVDSNHILSLDKVPGSLLVLGAGAVGMEFASIYKRFGTACTVIEMLPRALPVEDEEVSKEIERAFRKRKIPVRTGSKVDSIEVRGNQVHAHVVPAEGGGKEETLSADMLLVAIGRAPVTDGLGLESVGIKAVDGFIPVNGNMQTSVPGIYAIGDVTALEDRRHPMLAHVASHEGMVAAESIAGAPTRPLNYDRVPSVTYCDPEVASVGLSEAEAKKRGFTVKTGKFPFTPNAKARITGETDGFVKVVSDAQYDEVLGVHIIGPKATELIAEACAALNLETTTEELGRTIHAHPTLSEAMGEAAHGVHGNPVHI